jgi:Fe-S cluster assembly ATP-binding protein
MISIRDLHVSVEDKKILKGVSLELKPGEVHAVMGPNGSGKSTLAYTLAGHPRYTVEKGEVFVGDTSILEMSPDERAKLGVFLAFQYPVEIPGLSVQNFLRTAHEAKFGKLKSILDFRKGLKKIAEELHVKPELLERGLNEGFSGGEKKRLEILQMAVMKPVLAVLDETDSGLDIDAIKQVAEGVRVVMKKQKMAVLVITHYQRILKYLKPDAVHIMSKGTIVKSGGRALAQELERNGYSAYV